MTDSLIILRRGLFYVSLPLFFLNFALPVQAKQMGASALEIGGLFSLFTVSVLLLRPVVGYGLDRFGRRWFIVGAAAFYVFANALFAYADSIVFMYFARFFQGIGAALLLLSVDTMTADESSEEDRASLLGRNLETQARGTMVGAFIGFTLIGAIPLMAWRYSFAIFTLTALGAFLYLLIKLPETRKSSPDSAVRFDLHVSKPLQRLMLILFVSAFATALVQPIYLIYLQDKFDLPVPALAWAFLPSAFIFMLLPSRMGRLTGRWGAVNLLALGFLLSGFLYLILPAIDRFLGLVVLYTLAAVGSAMSEPARKALTVAYGDDNAVGRTFGVSEVYAGVGATLGPVVGGFLYDHYDATLTFALNGCLLMGSALLAKLMLSPTETGGAVSHGSHD
jgi:MFS family permease